MAGRGSLGTPPAVVEPALGVNPAAAGDPLASETLTTARPASLWRDTLGNVLRQRSAVVGLVILDHADPDRGLRSGAHAPTTRTTSLLGKEAGRREALGARASTSWAARRTSPQHIFGTRRQLPGRVQPRRLRRPDLAARSASRRSASRSSSAPCIGAVAGYVGGWIDNVLMRFMDVLLAFPSLLLAIAIVTVARPELPQRPAGDRHRGDPRLRARRALVRALHHARPTSSPRRRALGESLDRASCFRRILPNALTPLVVQGTLGIGGAVLEIAALVVRGRRGPLGGAPNGAR